MGNIYVTSDLHFGHDREFIWKARGYNSIEEMNEDYVHKWNTTVSDEDDVYVLGDLMLGDKSNIEYIKRLKGIIHIALGNHDTRTREEMYRELPNVVEVMWAIKLDYRKYHFLMTHFPTMTGNLEKESLRQMTLNLYGHTHQNTNFYEDRPYMYHVGVDSHNGYPMLLDTIIIQMKEKVNECMGFLGNEDTDEIHNSKESDIQKVIQATIENWPEWKKNVYLNCLNGDVGQMTAKPAAAVIYPRCPKCVHTFPTCGSNDFENKCTAYRRDPPDGGFYG